MVMWTVPVDFCICYLLCSYPLRFRFCVGGGFLVTGRSWQTRSSTKYWLQGYIQFNKSCFLLWGLATIDVNVIDTEKVIHFSYCHSYTLYIREEILTGINFFPFNFPSPHNLKPRGEVYKERLMRTISWHDSNSLSHLRETLFCR